ncbi:MAG: DUF6249 domain-containing protein [Bacteroidota bacterium]
MHAFIPLMILAPVGLTLYLITKTLTDYFLRKKMVEKGLVGEEAAKILTKEVNEVNRYSSLKWGLIILSGGIGLVFVEIFSGWYGNSSLPLGILSISISLGFLTYYFIVRNARKNDDHA